MALRELIEQTGGTITSDKTRSSNGASGVAHKIGDPALLAPSVHLAISALHAIPNADRDYDSWLAIGMAFKAATGGSEDTFDAWANWCDRYDGNTIDVAREKWESFTEASIGAGYLFAEAHKHGWNDDANADFADAPAEQKQQLPRIRVFDEEDGTPDPPEIIEGFIREAECSVWFGPSNVGKTFILMDAAFHVSLGWPWHGRDVEQCGVLYVALEGGFKKRRKAFRTHHGAEKTAGAKLAYITDPINLRTKSGANQLIEVVREAERRLGVPIRWIIIDTLSRALAGGDENSSDVMGALVGAVDRVRKMTKAHISLIHHAGKDASKGARGHSLVRGAVDGEFHICGSEAKDGTVLLYTEKQRELEKGRPLAFRLQKVDLGSNARGKPVSSCVVVPTALRPQLRKTEAEACEILNSLILETDDGVASLDNWRQALCHAELLSVANRGTQRSQWKRLVDNLKSKGVIEVYGDKVEART